jgi:predicted RNase H-like nuclease (RuvC/YqgF family)
MDNNIQTVLWGAVGAAGTALSAWIFKLALTPNQRISEMNTIVAAHSKMLVDISNELQEVLIENRNFKERIKELEKENHELYTKIEKLEKSDENNTRINKQARRIGS